MVYIFMLMLALSTINSKIEYQTLAPVTQIHDLKTLIPSMGKLGQSLIDLFRTFDPKVYPLVDDPIVKLGPEIFTQLEDILQVHQIRIYGYDYRVAEDGHLEVLFYLQESKGHSLNPLVVSYYYQNSSPDSIRSTKTLWGEASTKEKLSGDDEWGYYISEIDHKEFDSSGINHITPMEVLYRQFLIHSMYYILWTSQKNGIITNLPNTHMDTQGVAVPVSKKRVFFGVEMTDMKSVWNTFYTPNSFKTPQYKAYQDSLHERIRAFFVWITAHISLVKPNGIRTIEQLSFFIGNSLTQLLTEDPYQLGWFDALNQTFLGSYKQLLSNISSDNLSALFAMIHIDEFSPRKEIKLNQRFSNLFQTDGPLYRLKKQLNSKLPTIEDEKHLAQNTAQLFLGQGFYASVLEINTETNPWYDFDYLPKIQSAQPRYLVLVEYQGEWLIVDLLADQYVPKDRVNYYAYENPIPTLKQDIQPTRVPNDFTSLNEYEDLGVTVIPVQYFWKQLAFNQDVVKQKLYEEVKTLAEEIADEEGKEDMDMDRFIEDLMRLFDLEDEALILQEQQKIIEKYGFEDEDYDPEEDDEEDRWNQVLTSPKYELFPNWINRLLRERFDYSELQQKMIALGLEFYPYLGKWKLMDLDGNIIVAPFDINDLIYDPVQLRLKLFFNDFILRKMKEKFAEDLQRSSLIDQAA